MIQAIIDPSSAVRKLEGRFAGVLGAIANIVQSSTRNLLVDVQKKLSGEVLHLRNGASRRSIIETCVVAGTTTVSDSVICDGSVTYAHIQEYGGRVIVPEMIPKSAGALAFEYGGKLVFAKHAAAHVADIPERSFLRSSMTEQHAQLIDDIRKIATGLGA